jgi:hypothetical protein
MGRDVFFDATRWRNLPTCHNNGLQLWLHPHRTPRSPCVVAVTLLTRSAVFPRITVSIACGVPSHPPQLGGQAPFACLTDQQPSLLASMWCTRCLLLSLRWSNESVNTWGSPWRLTPPIASLQFGGCIWNSWRKHEFQCLRSRTAMRVGRDSSRYVQRVL